MSVADTGRVIIKEGAAYFCEREKDLRNFGDHGIKQGARKLKAAIELDHENVRIETSITTRKLHAAGGAAWLRAGVLPPGQNPFQVNRSCVPRGIEHAAKVFSKENWCS